MTLRPEPYRHLERDSVYRGLDAFTAAAAARGVDVAALALAWVLRNPRMDAAIVGARRSAHLDAALTALDVTLTDDEAARLGELFPV